MSAADPAPREHHARVGSLAGAEPIASRRMTRPAGRVAAIIFLAGALVMIAIALTVAFLGSLAVGNHRDAVGSAHVASSTTCGSDLSAFLSEGFSAVPANTTITLFHNACVTINNSLWIQRTTGLTINGNGATLRQTIPGTDNSIVPILFLTQDTNLTINNLNIVGPYDGTNGGSGVEGRYGIEMEADAGVRLSGLNVSNIQGDCLILQAPQDVNNATDALNTNVTVNNSTFNGCGYHGVTVESVDGFTLAFNRLSNIAVDAMDFEVDLASTHFTNGAPRYVAEDNVLIAANVWTNWGNDWFASLQGQTPGVQEQHVNFSGNVLATSGPLFEVVGTNPALTTPQYTNAYWTIENNAFTPGFYGFPYRGGLSVAGQLYDISHLTMENNTFPLCAGIFESPEPESLCAAPNEYLLDLDVITYSTIAHNDFSGALGVVMPQPYDTWNYMLTECGNRYGDGGVSVDNSC